LPFPQEKQAEAIVEKLCQRFRLTEEPRQWRDIAFCLSLLPFKSDRSVKKLTEGLQFYRDKLHEPKVFERFQQILDKARQNKSKDKPDAELDEFEKVVTLGCGFEVSGTYEALQILEEHKIQGQEDQALQDRVAKKAKKRAKAAGKGMGSY
jgi:condensin complex subunit 1